MLGRRGHSRVLQTTLPPREGAGLQWAANALWTLANPLRRTFAGYQPHRTDPKNGKAQTIGTAPTVSHFQAKPAAPELDSRLNLSRLLKLMRTNARAT